MCIQGPINRAQLKDNLQNGWKCLQIAYLNRDYYQDIQGAPKTQAAATKKST